MPINRWETTVAMAAPTDPMAFINTMLRKIFNSAPETETTITAFSFSNIDKTLLDGA